MIIDEMDYMFHEDPYGFIMRIDGYMTGYCGSVKTDLFESDIKNRFGDIIEKAKGVSLTFYWSDQSQEVISDLASSVELLLDEDANFKLSGKKDEKIADGFLEYEIILTGMKDSQGEMNARR